MPKSSDEIYAEVETRWAAEKSEHRKKICRRCGDVVLLGAPFVAFIILASGQGRSVEVGISIPFFTYLIVQLQNRWRLEERIARLEERMKTEPNQ